MIEVGVDSVSQVCVIMIDGLGCVDTACYIPQTSTILCANNLKINSSELTSIGPEPMEESLVKIEFTDEQGVVYSSEGAQNNAVFQLESISPYTEPSRPNESFVEVVFQVSCNLYSEGGQAFPFTGEINLALALPN